MSRFERQLREDRLLRDAAQALVKANINRVRNDLDERGLGQRALHRARDGAAELVDKARENAGATAGFAAVVLGALGLWLAREPLLEKLQAHADQDPENEPQAVDSPTPTGDEP